MKRMSVCSTALAALMALSAGCSSMFSSLLTTPTDPVSLTTGAWTSISSTTTLPNTCTDFHWTITEISGTRGSGTFTAKCTNNVQLSGTAQGTLTGTTVTWAASGTGTAPTGVACPFALSGTATFDGTQYRIPYSGTTCLGPVSGSEVLRKT